MIAFGWGNLVTQQKLQCSSLQIFRIHCLPKNKDTSSLEGRLTPLQGTHKSQNHKESSLKDGKGFVAGSPTFRISRCSF